MGRVTSSYAASAGPAAKPGFPLALVRAVDLVAGGLLLVLALPLMAVLALLVRQSSNGPVLHRRRTFHRGRPVEVKSFRTTLDGAGTASHERLRAVVGSHALPVTRVGAFMRVTRTDRLPRLLDVVAGRASLLL